MRCAKTLSSSRFNAYPDGSLLYESVPGGACTMPRQYAAIALRRFSTKKTYRIYFRLW